MTATITAGWLYGSLPDDKGREWPVARAPQRSTGNQHAVVDLVLHTTETDHLVPVLKYPSNFQCGDGKIQQHIRLEESGDAVLTYDRDCIGIEMVSRSRLTRWLPAESTLGPTVALVAWLHNEGHIRSGVTRPNLSWPVILDKLPAAVTSYYRRTDGTWGKPGVYGHVEVPTNEHYDPGSFDYPEFFKRVRVLTQGDADEMAYADFKKGWVSYTRGEASPIVEGDERFGWNAAKLALTNPAPAQHQHPNLALKDHSHTGTVQVK